MSEAMPLSHISHHEQIHLGQIKVLTTGYPKPVAVKRKILMNVRSETAAQADDGAGQELLQRHTRGQPVEIGGLV